MEKWRASRADSSSSAPLFPLWSYSSSHCLTASVVILLSGAGGRAASHEGGGGAICSRTRALRLPACRRLRFADRFLNIAQLVLAEEDFLADKEGGRAECAAVDGILRQLDEAVLDVGLLGAREEAIEIDAGRDEGVARDMRIVHLLGLFPHV